MSTALLDLAADAVARAMRMGATAADAFAIDRRATDVEVREGAIEQLERSEARELGLRVFQGQSSAVIAGSVLDGPGLDRLAEMGLAMAKAAPPDPFAGLGNGTAATRFPALDLVAESLPDAAALKAMALAAEDGLRGIAGVTKSGGAGASSSEREIALAASNGFAASFRRTGIGVNASAIAGSGTAMERDYDYSSAIHAGDLNDAHAVGVSAGTRAARRIHPRKVASQAVPVIYESRAAASLVGHLISAILGTAVARGTSFLKDRMGQAILPEAVTVIDDPTLPRGLSSRPFDAEGFPAARRTLVENGVLKTWLLDLRSARQLGLAPTGNAARGTSSAPAPSSSNACLAKGAVAPDALIKETRRGLFVTELIGMGVNIVTGDYSRGAAGFWIEDGELAYPVSEITIAGTLADMFARLTPADDLVFKSSTNAPTCRVEGLTIAGL